MATGAYVALQGIYLLPYQERSSYPVVQESSDREAQKYPLLKLEFVITDEQTAQYNDVGAVKHRTFVKDPRVTCKGVYWYFYPLA